jgi:hypothetical protein
MENVCLKLFINSDDQLLTKEKKLFFFLAIKTYLDFGINRNSNPETYIECCYKLEFKS